MKKFKLIKTYPGSPELGEIRTGNSRFYPSEECMKNNPEFWEEVIEFPVGTKVKDTIRGFIYTKTDKSWESISIQKLDESEIGEGKRFQVIEEPKKEYLLCYCDLKNGEYYTTEYQNQELYTFKQGYDLWINHRDKKIQNFNGDFKPDNGFHTFRKATLEEIKMLEPKKDYEILSFYSTSNQRIFTIQELNTTVKNFNIQNYIRHSAWYIHSVKRLSDNEVFTIGDEVKSIHWEKGSSIIQNFDFKNNKLIILEKGYNFDKSKWLSLEGIQHYKKPVLFTTEDGVDIREGDKFWYIDACNTGFYKGVATVKTTYAKYFSTKEAAEEYILMNKPCLSIKDVLSVGQRVIVDEGKLKQLVKSKL